MIKNEFEEIKYLNNLKGKNKDLYLSFDYTDNNLNCSNNTEKFNLSTYNFMNLLDEKAKIISESLRKDIQENENSKESIIISNRYDIESINLENSSINDNIMNIINDSRTYTNKQVNNLKDIYGKNIKKFKNFISLIIKCGTEINKNKIEIAMDNDMSLPDLFSYFDKNFNNFISFFDFVSIITDDLKINEQNIKREGNNNDNILINDIIYMLFSIYDFNYNDKLNFNEFSRIFLPVNKQFYDMMISHLSKDSFKDNRKFFDEKRITLVKNLIVCMLNSILSLNKFKESLKSDKNFSIYEIYEKIKRKDKSTFTLKNIQFFLSKNGLPLTENEILYVQKYIFYYTKKDDNYNYNDLVKLMRYNIV